MSEVIYKYILAPTDVQDIIMHQGAQLLHVGTQDDVLYVWAKVDTVNKPAYRRIRIIATGMQVSVPLGPFIGTVQMPSGLVWHIFDHGEVVDKKFGRG